MILRRLHAGDAPSVLALETLAMEAAWHANQVAEELRAPAGLAWGAEIEDRLWAFVFFRYIPPECELLRLVVHPKQRRRGVATALVQLALAHCAQLGCRICFLELRASNAAALQLYTGLGFQADGRRRCYYSNPEEDALLMHRNIILDHGVSDEQSA